MNVLPTAIDLLAGRADTHRAAAGSTPRRARPSRGARPTRSPQLPLALPLGRRSDGRPPSHGATSVTAPMIPPRSSPATPPPTPPALDAVTAAGALWAGMGSAGAITRLDAPEHGWPDALVQPGDAVLVAVGGTVAEGALAALRLRGADAVQLRRVHRSGGLHLRLQPEDRAVAPLIVPSDECELIGPVLTIVRRAAGEPADRRRTA